MPVLRCGHLAEEFLAPGDFVGEFLRVFVRAVGLLGLGQRRIHVEAQLGAQFLGALVGEIFVLGGAGAQVRAVDADGAELEQLHLAGQFKHLDEGGGDGCEVLTTEGANGVVVGMGVAAEVAHGDIAGGARWMRRELNRPSA